MTQAAFIRAKKKAARVARGGFASLNCNPGYFLRACLAGFPFLAVFASPRVA